MTTKDEIIDAMKRTGDTHPPAIFSQTGTTQLMDACGCYWPEANFELDKMVELALQPSKQFGFATARIPFDITVEAERLGCELSMGGKDRQPAVMGSPYNTGEILDPPDLMPVEDYLSGGRIRMYLDAAERISEEHPELFLTACMIGPMSVASYLTGMENFLMGMFISPEACLAWNKKLLPYQCEYAKALSEACDNVFLITEGSQDTMPADLFDSFVRPFDSKVIASIDKSFSTVHNCGDTSEVLEDLASLGSTALSVETSADPQGVFDRVSDKIVLVGGVDPIKCLLQGTPEAVKESARRYAAIGYPVIAPECGVPPLTRNENLAALASYRE